jgi:hypothetical protein
MQLPLKSVIVDVQNTDCLNTTSVTQIYINSEPEKINCSYAFNLDKDSAVTGLFITFSSNGRKMKGEIREKSEAKATYDSGVSRGKKSCLLQNLGNGHYNVEVGNVDPNETVVINYTYAGYISCTTDGYRYLFPTNIMEKYTSNPSRNSYAGQKMTHTSSPSYTFDLSIKWKSGTKITNVIHNMTIPVGVTNVSDNERIITMSSEPSFGDFSITLVTEIKPSLYVQKFGEDVYNMMSTRIEKAQAKGKQIRDYVCVLDRSGSMSGPKMVSALYALKLFIQSLPAESYFNVVSFGNGHTKLFTESQKYTDSTKKEALDTTATYTANMGGTEILSTLRSIGETPFGKDVNERIIVLLTDGGVTNENDVVTYARSLKNTRVFTIGVGTDVSRSLVERVASVGRGTCVCVVDVAGLDETIMDVLEMTSMQYYTNLTTEYFSDEGKVSVVSSLADTEYVYPGSYFKSFNLLKSDDMDKVKRVVVKGVLCGGDVSEWTIEPSTFVSADIDKFYTMKYISSVSNVSTNEAVALCVKHSVMSPQVSMVMVDEESSSSADKAIDVVVPHYEMETCREGSSGGYGRAATCAAPMASSSGYAREGAYDSDSDDGGKAESRGPVSRGITARGAAYDSDGESGSDGDSGFDKCIIQSKSIGFVSRGERRGGGSDSESEESVGGAGGGLFGGDDDDWGGGKAEGCLPPTTMAYHTQTRSLSSVLKRSVLCDSMDKCAMDYSHKKKSSFGGFGGIKKGFTALKSKLSGKSAIPVVSSPSQTPRVNIPVPAVVRTPSTVTASVSAKDLLDFQRADGSFHICSELLSLLKINEDAISKIMSKSHCTRDVAIYELILETLSKENKYRLAHKKTLDYVANVLRKPAPSSA